LQSRSEFAKRSIFERAALELHMFGQHMMHSRRARASLTVCDAAITK
jgi:hypothetical protein